jgi:hypothetical protein
MLKAANIGAFEGNVESEELRQSKQTSAVLALLMGGIAHQIRKVKTDPEQACPDCRALVGFTVLAVESRKREREEKLVAEAIQKGVEIGIGLSNLRVQQ